MKAAKERTPANLEGCSQLLTEKKSEGKRKAFSLSDIQNSPSSGSALLPGCVGGCLPALLDASFATNANAETMISHPISLDVAGMM